MYPGTALYTKEHEWIRMEGQTAVIGINDLAQDRMGDIVFVELPQGHHIAAAAPLAIRISQSGLGVFMHQSVR
jgi:glycine cleavage system H protein